MIKSITFTSKKNDFSWEGAVSENVDSKFNRWISAHPSASIKDIQYRLDGEIQSIFVLYEEDENFKEKLTMIEEGRYFIDFKKGKLIFSDRNIDVSYMVINFEGLRFISPGKEQSTCIADLFGGRFHRIKSPSEENHGIKEKLFDQYDHYAQSIMVHDIISKRYIPEYNEFNDLPRFILKENPGEYIINVERKRLYKRSNMLDVSYIVSGWYTFSRNIPIKYRYTNYNMNFDGTNFTGDEGFHMKFSEIKNVIYSQYLENIKEDNNGIQ